MKHSKFVWQSLIHSLGVLVYVSLVAWVMSNGQKWFGQANNLWGATAILLLFVLSATIVGLLILGRPAYWYFSGQKSEGLRFFFYTLAWLAVITVVVFVFLALRH